MCWLRSLNVSGANLLKAWSWWMARVVVRIARLMSAQADPNRWSALVSQGLDVTSMWCWPDGLCLSAHELDQVSPLRCVSTA